MLPPLRPAHGARPTPVRASAGGRAPSASGGASPAGAQDAALSQNDLESRIAAALAQEPLAAEAALERSRERFDLMARVRAETDRETTVLRELALDEMKREDELLKKWIALI
ncbi:MAG: hypothetical protein ABR591_13990 [Candidatus Velthaea sp.]